MSRSISTWKKSALARSYDLCFGDKKKKSEASYRSGGGSSSVACVASKLEVAEQKKRKNAKSSSFDDSGSANLGHKVSGPINMECSGPAQRGDLVTAQGGTAIASTGIDEKELSSDTKPISKEDQMKMAANLTDPQLMWDCFFSGILDGAMDAAEENLDESEADLLTSMEFRSGRLRMDHRAANVCSLPIKLILTPLRRGRKLAKAFASHLEMQFGPLHAALQIGDVVLEWNDSHLVTPYFCAYNESIVQIGVEAYSTWTEYISQHSMDMKKATEELDLCGQTELIFVIASKKKAMIDALIKVIIRYNKNCYYNLIDRNCQHFVSDALKALGVELPKEFTGGLRDYYKSLVKGRTPSIPEKFKTHHDLDKYVEESDLKGMPQHDVEFILAMYFRFHLESKEKLKEDEELLEEWECSEISCHMDDVETLIHQKSLLIHEFKPIS